MGTIELDDEEAGMSKKKTTKKTARTTAKKVAPKKPAVAKPTQGTTKKPTSKKTTKKSPAKRYEAKNKTSKTKAGVESYLVSLGEDRRGDCEQLATMMRTLTKDEGAMWGPTIAGFGHTHLVYETGREMDWFQVGFSSRKQAITIYLMGNFESRESLLEQLGPHKTGKGCLYIKRLSDIHLPTLKKLIQESCKAMKAANKG